MNVGAIKNLSRKYAGQKIIVFGLGKTGISSVKLLLEAGAEVYACDDNIDSIKKCDTKFYTERNYNSGTNYSDVWQGVETLILSPGIPLTYPKPHKIVLLANENNCKIICDVELLYQSSPGSKFIGITGTNGKSTTTALIGHILKSYNINDIEIGGNIGVSASSLKFLGEDGIYVIEMSSYQLDLLDEMKFDISILLNITPDHIDRHGSMEGYIKAKKNIFKHTKKEGTAIIAIDDEYCQEIAGKFADEFESNLLTVSGFGNSKINCNKADIEVFQNGKSIERLLRIGKKNYNLGEQKFLPGKHNMQNIVASCATISVLSDISVGDELLCYDIDKIADYIASFSGLEHRLQFVKQIDNITFINDSKATNAVATKHALDGYKYIPDVDIIWIAGGVAKDGGIESLQDYFPHLTHIFLYGQSAKDFSKTLDKNILNSVVNYTICDTLTNVFNELKNNIEYNNNSIVLFSPACASFDQYKNFEERGRYFCRLVGDYKSQVQISEKLPSHNNGQSNNEAII